MRVLVVPASKHGGTAAIGRRIANVLRDEGFDVDVSQPEQVHDLEHYGAHIVGSALYMGDWLMSAHEFVDREEAALRQRPTWLFSSGPLAEGMPKEPFDEVVVEGLLQQTEANEHRLFGGRLVLDQLGSKDRFVAQWAGATDTDFRNWDEIDAWARTVAEQLSSA